MQKKKNPFAWFYKFPMELNSYKKPTQTAFSMFKFLKSVPFHRKEDHFTQFPILVNHVFYFGHQRKVRLNRTTHFYGKTVN